MVLYFRVSVHSGIIIQECWLMGLEK